MKRRFKLWTAYMLIFCLSMAVMLPGSKSVKADDTGELIIDDFNIFLNGTTPLNKDVEVRDGDKLSVSFKWRLPDSDKTHSVFSTTIENYHHLKFIDKQSIDLRLSGNVVGRLTIDVDEKTGNVIVAADFTEEYLSKTAARSSRLTRTSIREKTRTARKRKCPSECGITFRSHTGCRETEAHCGYGRARRAK